MNYSNYERKNIEELSMALIGWPEDRKVENPSNISLDKGVVMKNALEKKNANGLY